MEPKIRYRVECKQTAHSPWTRPSVGNIEDGFASVLDAKNLIVVLRRLDSEYYHQGDGAEFRILKTVTTEVTRMPVIPQTD